MKNRIIALAISALMCASACLSPAFAAREEDADMEILISDLEITYSYVGADYRNYYPTGLCLSVCAENADALWQDADSDGYGYYAKVTLDGAETYDEPVFDVGNGVWEIGCRTGAMAKETVSVYVYAFSYDSDGNEWNVPSNTLTGQVPEAPQAVTLPVTEPEPVAPEITWSGASEWAVEWLYKASGAGLIPDCLDDADMTGKITRREFAAAAVRLYEAMTGIEAEPSASVFSDCDDIEVRKAVALGITNGTGDTTFSPDAELSREQCATMLTRVYKKAFFEGWTLGTDGRFASRLLSEFVMPDAFADDGSISAWAKDSVYFMKAAGVLDGVGEGMFSPRGVATREQAMKISVGMLFFAV